jgi:hypothetical protein
MWRAITLRGFTGKFKENHKKKFQPFQPVSGLRSETGAYRI